MKAFAFALAVLANLVFTTHALAGARAAPQLCSASAASEIDPTEESWSLSFADPGVRLGDRLFFDSRFSQFFFAHSNGDVNATLPDGGDPMMNQVPVEGGEALPGPFRGQAMNCRQCHLGSDFLPNRPRAGRTYGDFSRRSPIPSRGDGQTTTPRNSPLMINLGLPRNVPFLLHFDGEFTTQEDLVIAAFTGRNFGWFPTEEAVAIAHIAKVIREDKGVNPRHFKYSDDGSGVSYRAALAGNDPRLFDDEQIPPRFRIDVDRASDEEILFALARLIHAYTDSLRFGTDNTFRDFGSAYDAFLIKNRLPTWPEEGESDLDYAARLLDTINRRGRFDWVTPADGQLALHEQPFAFGPEELQGLRVFLARAGGAEKAHVGNCVSCHPPPQFTDYSLHNTGVSQAEYDAIFGPGAFAALDIPSLPERNADLAAYIPATPKHPDATGRFRAAPALDRPGYTDLGVWNIFANPDFPKPQAALTQILCAPKGPASKSCTPENILPLTIGYFKTPAIRDLGQSNPYFHTGGVDTIDAVLRFYVNTSDLARAGKLRNASREVAGIDIDDTDVAPLRAFLISLNEDYF